MKNSNFENNSVKEKGKLAEAVSCLLEIYPNFFNPKFEPPSNAHILYDFVERLDSISEKSEEDSLFVYSIKSMPNQILFSLKALNHLDLTVFKFKDFFHNGSPSEISYIA